MLIIKIEVVIGSLINVWNIFVLVLFTLNSQIIYNVKQLIINVLMIIIWELVLIGLVRDCIKTTVKVIHLVKCQRSVSSNSVLMHQHH